MAHTQAAASDATATIKLLLTHGAAVDLQDEAGATALLYAAQEGRLAAVLAAAWPPLGRLAAVWSWTRPSSCPHRD